jgi:CO/xanthine dehydrogenase Mo-binding subunit
MATYRVHSAAELPFYGVDKVETSSPSNPMGVKGVGEAGTIGALPRWYAVIDALQPLGGDPHRQARHLRAGVASDPEAKGEGA